MSSPEVVIIYDSLGVPMAVADGVALPSGTKGLIFSGVDGSGNAQFLLTSAAGRISADINSLPTVTITATSLDIRHLASGTDAVTAVQSGVWNIANITGTISLPVGAATASKQDDQTASLRDLADIVHDMNDVFNRAAAVAGQLNDSSPVLASEGKVAPLRITSYRALHANLRDESGIQFGTSGNPVRTDPVGTTTQPISVASLPLPTGAATEASLVAIDVASTRSDTYTSAASGVAVNVTSYARQSFAVQVTATGAVTSWIVILEASLDGVTFTTVLIHTNITPGNGLTVFSGEADYPCLFFRSRCSAITLGGGTNIIVKILGAE